MTSNLDPTSSATSAPLWQPSETQLQAANLTQYGHYLIHQGLLSNPFDYPTLHRWSVEHSDQFWSSFWDYSQIVADTKGPNIIEKSPHIKDWQWFPQARLNFSENLIAPNTLAQVSSDHSIPPNVDAEVIVSYLENGARRSMTREQLDTQVNQIAHALLDCGINVGDRVAGFLPNIIEAVVAMLATSKIGAIWTSCSPDFGISGALDRFSQTQPKVLFSVDYYYYNGKKIETGEKTQQLLDQVPSIKKAIIIDLEPQASNPPLKTTDLLNAHDSKRLHYTQLLQSRPALAFEALPFNHPLYILYSSGTTGLPKCIVHGAGGTLLQHKKEHQLHAGLSPGDALFFFTTCGWMMWNWLVSALASQVKIVLYDGSPLFPEADHLISLIDKEQITVFGAGAKYYSSLEKAGVKPKDKFQLTSLKSILSTGSPLSEESFDYIYREFKADVCLSSISGGTDIVSCFTLGNNTLPVYRGELQCPGLGMDVDVFSDTGQSITEALGELVCKNSFPSMPIEFWNDPGQQKYTQAYYKQFEGVWAHGDYIKKTTNNGYIIQGRSDAVLNPGGVRIGTAEIYRQVERIDEIEDSIVVGQDWQNDTRVILFVKLTPSAQLDQDLQLKIKSTLRRHATPRHVPALILAVADIPRTLSGKLVEMAVRNVIHNREVTNKDALVNPEALEYFKNRSELI